MDRNILTRTVWFLDYDGTLCPHQEAWEERAYDPADVLRTLNQLVALGARVLWNTGRRVESIGAIDPNFLDFSGFFIQGTIFWSAARREALVLSDPLPKHYSDFVGQVLQSQSAYRLELKPTSLRVSPARGASFEGLGAFVAPLNEKCPEGWAWIIGQRGAELLPDEFNKGSSLRRELAMPISKNLIPVAVGDDLLDRPALEESLLRGGYAILVGPHKGILDGLKAATGHLLHFSTPEEFTEWLRSL